jgi:hypothetical protein
LALRFRFLSMLDAFNEANLKIVVKCMFVGAILGAFGGTLKKVEPVLTVPVTRVIDQDGKVYEVGYDFIATHGEDVSVQGQPRFSYNGYQLQGPKVDLDVPQPIKSRVFLKR